MKQEWSEKLKHLEAEGKDHKAPGLEIGRWEARPPLPCAMAYFKPHLCSWGCRHAWAYLTDWKEEPEGVCLHKKLR